MGLKDDPNPPWKIWRLTDTKCTKVLHQSSHIQKPDVRQGGFIELPTFNILVGGKP